MSSRVVHALNAPYRAIPDGLAFRVTAPIIRWACNYAAEEGETVEYDGRGSITYVGDDGERQMGRNEAAISLIPGMVWFSTLFLLWAFSPVNIVTTVVFLALVAMALVSTTVVGKIEINDIDKVHHL